MLGGKPTKVKLVELPRTLTSYRAAERIFEGNFCCWEYSFPRLQTLTPKYDAGALELSLLVIQLTASHASEGNEIKKVWWHIHSSVLGGRERSEPCVPKWSSASTSVSHTPPVIKIISLHVSLFSSEKKVVEIESITIYNQPLTKNMTVRHFQNPEGCNGRGGFWLQRLEQRHNS